MPHLDTATNKSKFFACNAEISYEIEEIHKNNAGLFTFLKNEFYLHTFFLNFFKRNKSKFSLNSMVPSFSEVMVLFIFRSFLSMCVYL